MDRQLNRIESRINVHASRIPKLIDIGASQEIIEQELEVLNRLCADYAKEYLATLSTVLILSRYCKVLK